MEQFIDRWQTLIGSLVGAATPISLWFLKEWYQKRKNHKAHLYALEKLLVYNINNLLDARDTLKYFINNRLPELIININSRTDEKIYSIDTAFFPLISLNPHNENILDINTGSGYVDNKVLQALKMSEDFSVIINDLRQQFISTIQLNQEMAINKLNPPELHNIVYVQNIENFKNFVSRDVLNKSMEVYLKTLVSARTCLGNLHGIGIFYWKIKFEPHFIYFRNKKELKKFSDINYERIEKFFEEEIELEIKKLK